MHQRGRGADGIVEDDPGRVHPDHQLLVLIQPLHRRRPVSLASSALGACVLLAGSEPGHAGLLYIKRARGEGNKEEAEDANALAWLCSPDSLAPPSHLCLS